MKAGIIAALLLIAISFNAQTLSNKSNLDKSGKYAIVAGGSKGIGYAIAFALAKRKYNLVLIARHADSLFAAREKLQQQFGIKVEILQLDLAYEKSSDSVLRFCMEKNLPVNMLCNVAGMGGTHDFLTLPGDSLRYMVRLNIESTMALTLALLPILERNAPSHILNVASMAGFAPIPVKNMYSATKSAVIFFSYALRYQLEDKNIHVSCLAPGPVFTKPSVIQDTRAHLGKFGMKMAVSPQRVGEIAVKKTLKGRMIIVPGFLAGITSSLIRILPRRWVTAIYHKLG